ncbi:MAG: hypothetical protein DME97_02275 [Verrucomicrobia bacterium]|nr:MAG: hypothetical protein DME97_02275 [Verrucomicrobiota bacterium]
MRCAGCRTTTPVGCRRFAASS